MPFIDLPGQNKFLVECRYDAHVLGCLDAVAGLDEQRLQCVEHGIVRPVHNGAGAERSFEHLRGLAERLFRLFEPKREQDVVVRHTSTPSSAMFWTMNEDRRGVSSIS